jgi:phosphoribosylaminoimidazole carboxylase PurE protein
MKNCERYLQYFGVEYEKMVLSAHRNPIETIEFARNAEERGFKVIIAGAGMAAHLPGVIAANTTLPVIGVPIPSSELNGVDSLYSIVQMPPGIPVATVAIGKSGAVNAAVLAVQMLALQDENLKKKLEEFRSKGSKL